MISVVISYRLMKANIEIDYPPDFRFFFYIFLWRVVENVAAVNVLSSIGLLNEVLMLFHEN